jgi:hypothetical protein
MRHVRRSLAALLVCVCCFGLLATGCKKKKDKPYIPPWSETAEVAADEDAIVDELMPDTNYGSNTSLWAGYFMDFEEGAYFHFDLVSTVPIASDVVTAELWVYISETENSLGLGFVFKLQRAIEAWAENTLTWNTEPNTTDVCTFVGPGNGYVGWFKITDPVLTALVQIWVDDPAQNMGLAIVPNWSTPSDDDIDIDSRENLSGNAPKLKVYYNP